VDGPPPTKAALAVALAYFAAGLPVPTPPYTSPQAKAGAGRDLRLSRAIDAALRQAGLASAPSDDVSVPPLPPRLRPPALAAEWLGEMLAESQRLGIPPAEVNSATIATAVVRARRHDTGEAVKSEMRAAVRHLERLEQDCREHPDAYALDALDWAADKRSPTSPGRVDAERLERIHAMYSARLQEVSGASSWEVRRPRPGETPSEYGQVCRRVVERASVVAGVLADQPAP